MKGNMKPALEKLAINGGPKVRTAPWPTRGHLGKEEKAAADALFDQAIATGNAFGYNGETEDAYCGEFADFLGCGYADAVNSGTSAVYVALRALNVEPFTKIVVSSVTDPGGMMPIVMLNCIPVVADSASGCYNTGPDQIGELISPLTSAIVIAHIGGEPADIEAIVRIARKHNIPVVEDCAQAHGCKLNGQHVGTFGDIAAFSTMFGKHYCTSGQGGIVFTKNEELYWAARRASDRGKPFAVPQGATNSIASLNFNLNDLAAAIGRVQLKKLPWIVDRRRRFVARLAESFKDLKSIKIPQQIPGAEPSYWWWRLKVNLEEITCSKKEFCDALSAEGLILNPDYSSAVPHTFDWFKNRSVFGSSGYPWACPLYKGDPKQNFPCPNTHDAIARHFNLVIYESWEEKEARDIITIFKKVEDAFSKKNGEITYDC